MDNFLDVVGVAAEFSANSNGGPSSGSAGRGDQRLPCSLSCFGKWEIVQGACTMVSHCCSFYDLKRRVKCTEVPCKLTKCRVTARSVSSSVTDLSETATEYQIELMYGLMSTPIAR